jgi:hypothetical protein
MSRNSLSRKELIFQTENDKTRLGMMAERFTKPLLYH